tara:strand:- start:93 stop:245 length:153 start_codon:yes stop_codon:yes gene_type:complete
MSQNAGALVRRAPVMHVRRPAGLKSNQMNIFRERLLAAPGALPNFISDIL